MRFALVKAADNSIVVLASNVDPAVQTKPGFKWLPCAPATQPVFDQTSEKIVGPTYTVNASDVTEVWAKVGLSAQEIADQKDGAIIAINGGTLTPVLKMFLNLHNRVLALEGKPTVTMPQFKAALKALL